jgi:hypothetical protein
MNSDICKRYLTVNDAPVPMPDHRETLDVEVAGGTPALRNRKTKD